MNRRATVSMIVAMLAGLAAIAVAALIVWYRIDTSSQAKIAGNTVQPSVKIGGPFTLHDQDGKTFTDADLKGKYALVYFGYTFCPDVCPTELAIVGSALNEVEEKSPELAAKVVPVFISVDPDRDTSDVLKAYVPNFHPRMIGLSGTADQIAKVAKEYRVYYAKGKVAPDGSYLMDHSSFVYFMGPDGALITMFRHNTDPSDMANEIEQVVSGKNG